MPDVIQSFFRSLVLALVLVLLAGEAFAWVNRVDSSNFSSGTPRAMAVASNGDVVTAGGLPDGGIHASFSLIRLDATTGVEQWRQSLDGDVTLAVDEALAIALDASGDALAAGYLENATGQDFTVVKVDGSSGAELWRQEVDGSASGDDQAVAVAVDASGDVFAGGYLATSEARDFTVIKFDGSTGAELWRAEIDGTDPSTAPGENFDEVRDMVLDSNGDVVAVGHLDNAGGGRDFVVVKLDGSTGGEAWRQEIDGAAAESDMALGVDVDSSGGVVATGVLLEAPAHSVFPVIKFDGTTGVELWREIVDGVLVSGLGHDVATDGAAVLAFGGLSSPSRVVVLGLDGATGAEAWRFEDLDDDFQPTHMSVGPAGDVVLSGRHEGFSVRKLDGATGAELWHQAYQGSRAYAHVIDAAGDVFAGGSYSTKTTTVAAFTIVKLSGDDGSQGALDGRVLLVKDPGDPAKRLVKFVLKSADVPTLVAGEDIDPALHGATIRIRNPTTLEEATFLLPAGPAWKALGNPAFPKGYKYKGDPADGPCRTLTAKFKTKLTVKCTAKHAALPFTLDELSQGSLEVSVTFGELPQICASFGGLVVKDEPGFFRAKAAPAGPRCS